jgi:uncharacterized membrane protein
MQNSISSSKKTLLQKFVWCILLGAYIFFLLFQAGELSIWVDEAYTLITTANPLPTVIKRSYNFEGQPPLYFMLLAVWRWMSQSIFFARCFSVISVLFSAYMFYKLLKLVIKENTGCIKWLLAVYLLNPFTVWAALEIRLYAFLLALSVSAIYFFVLFLMQKQNRHLVYFSLISIAGLYTQYYFVFLMAGLVLAATVIKKDWPLFIKMVLYCVPVILLFLPNLFFMSGQLGLVQTFKTEQNFLDRFITVWASVKNVLLSMHLLTIARAWRLFILTFFIVLFAAAFYNNFKTKKIQAVKTPGHVFLFAVALLIMLIIVSLFTAILQIDHIDRYLTVAFPLCTLLFLSFNKLTVIKPAYGYAAVLIYFTGVNAAAYTKPLLVKTYDYKSLAAYITQINKTGEPLLFYRSGAALPFNWYYKGANAVVPLPHPINFSSTETDYAVKIKDTATFTALLAKINAPQKTFLLITNLTENIYANSPDKILVDDYIKHTCSVTLDTLYFGNSKNSALRIRRIEKK